MSRHPTSIINKELDNNVDYSDSDLDDGIYNIY